MKALGRALRVDLRRSVCSLLFFFTVLLLFAWLVFNSGEYLNSEMYRRTNCMAEILNYTLTGTLTLAELVLAIAAVTYGWSYSRDRACGFFSQAVARVGTPAYSVARAVSVALSAFLAGVVALGLYLLFLTTLHLPGPNPNGLGNRIAYLELVSEGRSGLYFMIRILIVGLTCSFAAEFGLMVTAFCPNAYMALLSPVLLYYFQEVLGLLIHMPPKWFLVRVMFGQTHEDPIQSFWWAASYLVLGTVLFGVAFCRRIRKEQES